MQAIIHREADRGTKDIGWLLSKFSFSFSSYQNPARNGFGLLKALNDDRVNVGGGFGLHAHTNMEIISIMLQGKMTHKDNLGYAETVEKDWVQIMSAGTGVQHSEANDSAKDPVTLFQVWIYPKKRNITPRYDQRTFNVLERINKWQYVVSPQEKDAGLWINQDARFAMTNLEAGKTLHYENAFKGNGVYLVVINGSVELEENKLNKRDAVGIEDTEGFTITASEDAELLVIEVPMNSFPSPRGGES